MTKEQKKSTSGEVLVEKQETKEIVAQENQIVKPEADIDAYIELRQEFIKKVNAICVEGKDYHVIQGKKSLAKGGAEKIASIFKWTAKFDKDTEALEMLGQIVGLVAFKCTLMNGHFVGEGRGATTLAKNAGDVNKTLKMAQKSAFIDAVLRASGLSDFFTQDLQDMDIEDIKKPFNKNDWQNNNRAEFKQANGFSQTTNYRFGGGDTRSNVLKRDGYKCVVCGMSDEEHLQKWGKPITVDHIDKNEKNNAMVNLQTLCLTCHGKKDIIPELTEQKIPEHKEEIKTMRASGMTYQAIADKLGFSLAGVWKWIQKWNLEDMPAQNISKPQYTNDGNIVENRNVAQPQRKPTEKQSKFIKQLCQQKHITQDQVIEMAKGKNPSQLIEQLLAYQQPQGMPVIQQDETPAGVVSRYEAQQQMEDEDPIASSVPF